MKTVKLWKTVILGINMLVLFVFIASLRAEGELTVTNITRISHPAYQASNMWFGVRNPWNRDYTKIMLYENPAFTHPSYGKTGRGLVWGFIGNCGTENCVTEWTTLSEYESYVKPIPDQIHITRAASAYWSPFVGEENIIYAPFYSGSNCNYLKKINVGTGMITDVVSINDAGVDCSAFTCYGWTDSNKLVCSMGNENWSGGGYEIDVQAKTKTFITGYPAVPSYLCNKNPPYTDDKFFTWPDYITHGHGGKNPGDTWYLNNYGNGTYPDIINTKGAIRRTDCSVIADSEGTSKHVTHVSWTYSNNWFLGSSCGDSCTYQPSPYIDIFRLYQVFFNGSSFTYRELLAKSSAGRWDDGTNSVLNYQSIPIATLRNDGRQFVFMSTDGKYSYGDFTKKGSTPWGTEGFFLADFAPASDTTSPAPPTGLKTQ